MTTLNKEVARQFMRVSDLRLNVVIEDSDKRPERTAVSVGSDILAWRAITPLSELTKVVLRPKKFHQTEVVDGRYRILVHDRIIDDDIQKKGFQDREDYESRYLAQLNREVKSGLAETIWKEKLGLRAQLPNHMIYMLSLSFLPLNINLGPTAVMFFAASLVFLVHPMLTFRSNMAYQRFRSLSEFTARNLPELRMFLPPHINPRSWKAAMMPVVPVDKWVKGRRFLAEYGNELIIPRSENE